MAVLFKKKKMHGKIAIKYYICANYCTPVFDFSLSPLRVTQPASGAWLRTCCALPGCSFVLVRLGDNIQELPLEAPLLPRDLWICPNTIKLYILPLPQTISPLTLLSNCLHTSLIYSGSKTIRTHLCILAHMHHTCCAPRLKLIGQIR